MPTGGFPMLMEAVDAFAADAFVKEGRPFAKGERLVAYAENIKAKEEDKPMRVTEAFWKQRGVNVRSTLWNGPRGGAPFTTACITLLAKAKRPVWPWVKDANGLLVEAFPAGQLRCWELPNERYQKNSREGAMLRDQILIGISERIVLPDSLRNKCRDNADALDAVLCLFSATAAANGTASCECAIAAETEGWIAVHPV